MSEETTVAKNTLFLTVGSIVQKLLAFVYFTLLARHFLPPEDVGKYLYALSYVALFSVIVDFGMQPTLIREIAKDKTRTGIVVSNALGIKIVFALLTVGAMIVSSRLTEVDPVKIALITIASLTIILDSAQLTFYAVLRGYQKLNHEAIGVLIGQVITVSVGALVLVLNKPLPFLMFSFVAGSLWNAIYSFVKATRVSKMQFKITFERKVWVDLLKMSLPFAIAAIFVRIYSSADSVLLNKLAGNVAAAFYGVPYKFVFAFQFIPIALAAAIYPAFARDFETDKNRVGDLFVRSQRYLMLIVFPLVAGMIVLAEPIIVSFYREQYLASVPIMVILAWCLIPAFLDFPVGALLNATRKQNIQTTLMGVVMVISIVLNIILIPRFGAVGSAVTAVFGNSVLFIGGLIYASRIVTIPWKKLFSAFLRIGLASIAMAATVSILAGSISLYLSIGMGVLIYIGALFVTREIGKSDVVKIRDLILPPRLSEVNKTETSI